MTADEMFIEVCGYKKVPRIRLRWPYLACYEKKDARPHKPRMYVRFKLGENNSIRVTQWQRGGMDSNLIVAIYTKMKELGYYIGKKEWEEFINGTE